MSNIFFVNSYWFILTLSSYSLNCFPQIFFISSSCFTIRLISSLNILYHLIFPTILQIVFISMALIVFVCFLFKNQVSMTNVNEIIVIALWIIFLMSISISCLRSLFKHFIYFPYSLFGNRIAEIIRFVVTRINSRIFHISVLFTASKLLSSLYISEITQSVLFCFFWFRMYRFNFTTSSLSSSTYSSNISSLVSSDFCISLHISEWYSFEVSNISTLSVLLI